MVKYKINMNTISNKTASYIIEQTERFVTQLKNAKYLAQKAPQQEGSRTFLSFVDVTI